MFFCLQYVAFTCGLVRGALSSLGVKSIVTVEVSVMPACKTHIIWTSFSQRLRMFSLDLGKHYLVKKKSDLNNACIIRSFHHQTSTKNKSWGQSFICSVSPWTVLMCPKVSSCLLSFFREESSTNILMNKIMLLFSVILPPMWTIMCPQKQITHVKCWCSYRASDDEPTTILLKSGISWIQSALTRKLHAHKARLRL